MVKIYQSRRYSIAEEAGTFYIYIEGDLQVGQFKNEKQANAMARHLIELDNRSAKANLETAKGDSNA